MAVVDISDPFQLTGRQENRLKYHRQEFPWREVADRAEQENLLPAIKGPPLGEFPEHTCSRQPIADTPVRVRILAKTIFPLLIATFPKPWKGIKQLRPGRIPYTTWFVLSRHYDLRP